MNGSVALLLGRPPGPRSVLPEVVERLRGSGLSVTVDVVTGTALPPAAGSADLRVHKDLAAPALRALCALGAPTCDDPSAVLVSLDKAEVTRALHRAGVRVPGTRLVGAWPAVRALADAGPVVVKPRAGSQGHGVQLLDGPAPASPPVPGPWLVQERVSGDGLDRKLYVVGDRVLGLARSWPAPADRRGTAYVPDAAAVRTARAAARALRLEVCGVDVLVGDDGAPVVVDVNAFPGFKHVPDAAAHLAAHLRSRTEVLSCASSS